MKKIFTIILSSLVLMTSCKEEIEENWSVDSLTISCESLKEAGDGNLKVALPTEFSGVIKLNIESNSQWKAEVSDITVQKEEWITLSSVEGQGNGTIDINIAPNSSAVDRIGSLVIKTTGNIPVKKTVTLIQGNIDDMLSLSINEEELPEGVTVKEGVEGSFNLTLPKDFPENENIYVVVNTTSFPEISIDYPEGMQKNWLTMEQMSDSGNSEIRVVAFAVAENVSKDYRESIVTFKSISGSFEVKRTLNIAQLGEEKVIWTGNYFQGILENTEKCEIILPSYRLENVKVAELQNIMSNNIEVQETDWFTLNINESGEVLLTVTKENNSTNKENTANLVLKSKLSGTEFKIPVRQCLSGYGVSLNKQLWSLKGIGNKRTLNHESCKKLCDNAWGTPEKKSGTYFEIGSYDRDPGTAYEIFVDLGENHLPYNSIGLIPRLEWTACSPKTLEILTSDNNSEWTTVIGKEDGNGFKKDEICHIHEDWREDQKDGSSYNNWKSHWEAPVKWYLIDNAYRYIKIRMYDTFGSENNSNSNNLCIDELFVTNRETE